MALHYWCRYSDFEYSYRFSVDKEIIPLYINHCTTPGSKGAIVIEIRSNFVVKGREKESEKETTIAVGSERFGTACTRGNTLRISLRNRLMDYWLSLNQIDRLLDMALLFARSGGGRRPTVVDLEVCTPQMEGEAMEAAVERAMRPDYMPSLDLRPEVNPNRDLERCWEKADRLCYLGNTLLVMGVRVNDVEKGMKVMEACCICGGKPFVGSCISELRCRHVFHYHCLLRRIEEDLACPICRHPPWFGSEGSSRSS